MATYLHADVLDNGPAHLAARATAGDTLELHLLKAYTQGDSYATVTGNSIGKCTASLAAGDFTLGNQGTYGRKLTVATKGISVTVASGGTPNLHIAILNTTSSKVFAVTDETTNAVLNPGDVRQSPAWDINFNQPT